MRLPRLRMFAGPNGSGKSTIRSVLPQKLLGVYLNPDEIQKEIKDRGFLDVRHYGVETTREEILPFFSHSALLQRGGGDADEKCVGLTPLKVPRDSRPACRSASHAGFSARGPRSREESASSPPPGPLGPRSTPVPHPPPPDSRNPLNLASLSPGREQSHPSRPQAARHRPPPSCHPPAPVLACSTPSAPHPARQCPSSVPTDRPYPAALAPKRSSRRFANSPKNTQAFFFKICRERFFLDSTAVTAYQSRAMKEMTEEERWGYDRACQRIREYEERQPKGILTSVLSLNELGISKLPPEIESCWELRFLSAGRNRLSSVPDWIFTQTGLQYLDLSYNLLQELPERVGQLTILQELSLAGNRLRAVPEQLGALKELKRLNLAHNDLSELPESLLTLPNLNELYLHGNPKLEIPGELLGPTWSQVRSELCKPANPKEILGHYLALRRDGERPLNEARIVLIGRGGAGKSSLVQRLIKGEFNPGEKETPGVALSEWKMHGCSEAPVTAHVWDFAGQVITHSMHRYFLSHRTIYLLVLTQREDMAMDDADYWLKLIQSYGSSGEHVCEGPPVFVVLNKSDDGRVKIDPNALRERYPFIVEFVETDCASGRGIDELRDRLCQIMDEPKVGEWVRVPYPAKWWKVKAAIEEAQKTDPHMSYDAWRQLCAGCGVTDRQEQDTISGRFHTLGVALNYANDERLSDNTVLRPNWVTHHCYNLIRHAATHQGELWRAELDTVLRPERDGVPGEPDPTMQFFLMRLMERFEVAYPLGEDWPPERWLVPLGLPDGQPDGIESFGRLKHFEAVRLRYAYTSVPPGLIAQFIIRTHSLMEVGKQWANGTVLTLNGARALVRAVSKTEVEVTASGANHDARRDLAGLCREELRELHAQMAGLSVVETTEVVAEGQRVWVKVQALEKDEQKGRNTSGIATDEGTILIDTRKELDEFGTAESRLPSWPKGAINTGIGREEDVRYSNCKPKLFISYSHRDERHRRAFESYLKILKIQGLIDSVWHDRCILPGRNWHAEITHEIASAHVVLFLLSTASLTSDYIQGVEFAEAMKRRQNREAEVVLIVLEPCDWIDTLAALPPFSSHPDPKRQLPQAIPRDNRPVRSFSPQKSGWHQVAEELKKLLVDVKERMNRPDH